MALYLNVSQPMGGALNWSEGERLDEMDGIFAELIRQINFIVSNLGADNVIEAASVKAENIDTKNAKIVNAQIKNLTASKIEAGTLDLNKKITISGSSGKYAMYITQSSIEITEEGKTRFAVGMDEAGQFGFGLYDKDGDPKIVMTEEGNAVFTGTVESSEIYSSHIVGTGKDTYGEYTPPENNNGVFVDIDNKGIKVMQDMADGNRLQKIGMTSDTSGNAKIVIGSGTGDGIVINGVKEPVGSMTLSKTYDNSMHTGKIAVSGNNSALLLDVNGGTLDIYAKNLRFHVYNGIESTSGEKTNRVATEKYVDQQIENVKTWVLENYQPIGS